MYCLSNALVARFCCTISMVSGSTRHTPLASVASMSSHDRECASIIMWNQRRNDRKRNEQRVIFSFRLGVRSSPVRRELASR